MILIFFQHLYETKGEENIVISISKDLNLSFKVERTVSQIATNEGSYDIINKHQGEIRAESCTSWPPFGDRDEISCVICDNH